MSSLDEATFRTKDEMLLPTEYLADWSVTVTPLFATLLPGFEMKLAGSPATPETKKSESFPPGPALKPEYVSHDSGSPGVRHTL